MADATHTLSEAADIRPETASSAPCPGCGAGGSELVYELIGVPVHDVQILRRREAALSCDRGDIRLDHCGRCGLIWNRAFDPTRLDYAVDYESTQAFSPTFNRFHERLANDLVARYGLRGKKLIEIGCGQGDFLALLCEAGGNSGIGFDPAYAGGNENRNYEVVPDYYSTAHAGHDADFVCCKMTLEHIHDVGGFLRTVRRALGERRDLTVFFQIPEMRRILRERAFWDIYYEHCSYFSAGSLARLFRAADFRVDDIWSDYDDQYLMIEARPGAEAGPPHAAEESPKELAADVRRFRTRVGVDRGRWRNWLSRARDRGERVVLWGGGSKAVAFLTSLDVTDEVACAVDINPRKAGTYLAGAGQEVVPPAALKEQRPDSVLVMNPIYREEVAGTLKELGLAPRLYTVEAETCEHLDIDA